MEIDRIKNEYTKKMNDRIKKYSGIILESFIEFYGKKNEKNIIDRFQNIDFLYYINDYTIFYILDSLKNEDVNKIENVFFIIPYLIYLVQNHFYKQEVSEHNFYELGINKIVGVSNDKLLCVSNLKLIRYFFATALRSDNQNPYEINIPFHQDIKRIIALPLFSVSDKDFFHELNHAICSESIIQNGEILIKCGLDYSNNEKSFASEIVNDLLSIDVYNIFKSKCQDTIFDDNLMKEVYIDVYSNYHKSIAQFYEENKERIKMSSLYHSEFQLKNEELKSLSKLLKL